MENEQRSQSNPLDRVLSVIAGAIRQYQREIKSLRIKQGFPQTGNQESIPIPDIDPNQPMHIAATIALATVNHPAHVKDLQPILRKLYNRRISPTQIYMALEYRRRQKGDVDRERGGLWYIPSPPKGEPIIPGSSISSSSPSSTH